MYICIYVRTYVCMHICVCICMCVCVCMCIYVYVCIYVYMCMYVCVYVCICIYLIFFLYRVIRFYDFMILHIKSNFIFSYHFIWFYLVYILYDLCSYLVLYFNMDLEILHFQILFYVVFYFYMGIIVNMSVCAYGSEYVLIVDLLYKYVYVL